MTHVETIAAAIVLGALLLVTVGAAFHWWVLDVRYWLDWLPRRTPLDLPGPAPSMPAPGAGELHDDWDDLDPDQQAGQLIAEWHAPDHELTAEDWIARDLADLELLAWDARVQAARCWEILHVEFPRLRAELCAA